LLQRIGLFATTVLLLLGPVLGVVAHQFASKSDRDSALSQIDDDTASRVYSFESKVSALLEVLYAMRSLYDSSDRVTREDFRFFTKRALSRHPAIQALEWAPYVPADNRSEHESQTRRDGLTEYAIKDRDPSGELIPSPMRDEYFPVYFVEPHMGNECAMGFDLGSEEIRRAALTRAMDTGELTLTEPIVLVQETGSSMGFLGFLPVYDRQVATAIGQLDHLRGFVVLVFRIEEVLVQSLLVGVKEGPAGMRFQLIDSNVNDEPQIIWSSTSYDAETAPEGRVFQTEIVFGAQQWSFRAYPTKEFLAQNLSKRPLAIGIVVFLVWEMLFGLVFSLGNSPRDIALRKQGRILRSVSRSLAEGIAVSDSKGNVLFASDSAARLLGLKPDEVPTNTWSAADGFYLPDAETPYPRHELPLIRAMRGEEVLGAEIFVRNTKVPDGRWLSVNATPLLDEKGSHRGGVVVFRDVTKRKTSEELVERLSNAVEQTGDAVLITDLNGRIQYVNRAFETSTGYTREEVLGETPRILRSGAHSEAHYKKLWETILRGEIHRGTLINRKKNGETYHAEQTITPMKDSAGRITHFVSLVKDMTEIMKRQEQEIEMHLASLVQEKLYPQQPPCVEGFDIAGATFPAEVTCGDYYDFITMPNDSLGIAIGDVSGHGLGPALVMAQTRAYLRSLSQTNGNLPAILCRLNQALFSTSDLCQCRTHTRLHPRWVGGSQGGLRELRNTPRHPSRSGIRLPSTGCARAG
jgi:PAS domain S-box-containing protein